MEAAFGSRSGNANSELILLRPLGLSLMLVGENLREEYQVNQLSITIAPFAESVAIDIRPFAKCNIINPHSRAAVWVAVLSDLETDFDPLQIDISTVRFGPEEANATRHKVRDIDRDGWDDLLLRFKIQQTGIECGDREAILTGETFSGDGITGTDSIQTIGCQH